MFSTAKEVKNQLELNKLSIKEQIEWLLDPTNLLFKGDFTTKQELPDEYALEEKHLSITPEHKIRAYQNAWWESNRKNYWQIFRVVDKGEEICDTQLFDQKEKEWNSLIEDVSTITKTLKELFQYAHSLKSFKNDLIGELAFYFFISIIMKKKRILDISVMDYHDKVFSPFVGIIMQDSRTGKDESLKMMLMMNKLMNQNPSFQDKIDFHSFEAGTRVETLYSRPKMTKGGQVKIDKTTNKAEKIVGTVESNDWLYSSECSHLFRKVTEGSSALEFFLLAWQWDPVSKELVGWNGEKIDTIPRASFWGVSRPVDTVKEVITGSGLLQRAIFIPRNVSNDIKKEMMKKWLTSRHDSKIKQEYRKNLKILSSEMVKLSQHSFDTFRFNPEHKEQIEKVIQDCVIGRLDFIQTSIPNPVVSKIMETFASGLAPQIEKLSQICAFYKKREMINLEDVEEAITFLTTVGDYQLPWFEETLIEEEPIRKERSIVVKKILKEYKGIKTFSKALLVKFLAKELGKSQQTIYNLINSQLLGSEGSQKLLYCTDETKKVFKVNPSYLT